MDKLDTKMMKLFILADAAGNMAGQYEYVDLLYSLLEEIKEIKPIYEEHRQTILDLA